MTAATPTPRLKRGKSEPIGNGLRRDHTVACTATGNPEDCDCPYSFWLPRTTPRRRVKVHGSLSEALALKQRYQQHKEPQVLAALRSQAVATIPLPRAATAATPTLGEWVERLFAHTWRQLSPRTLKMRRSVYRQRILPHLSELLIDEIAADVIEDWLAVLIDVDGRTRAVESAYEVLRAIIGAWTNRQGRPNPVSAVKHPRDLHRESVRARDRVLTRGQYEQLLAACMSRSEHVLIRTAVECGLRTGELCGLQRRHIDVDGQSIVIERQGRSPTTKNGRTRRVIMTEALADDYASLLRAMDTPGRDQPDSLIWRGRGPRGTQQQPNCRPAMYQLFARIIRRAGLVDDKGDLLTTPHGLRATGATLAAQAGVHPVGDPAAAGTCEFLDHGKALHRRGRGLSAQSFRGSVRVAARSRTRRTRSGERACVEPAQQRNQSDSRDRRPRRTDSDSARSAGTYTGPNANTPKELRYRSGTNASA